MSLILSMLAGIALGIVFYGGLWLTVRRLATTRHPVVVTMTSYLGRTVIVLAGFLMVMNGRWENAVACLAGFVLGRIAVSAWLPRAGGTPRCT
jgi:F1F0 ATPase subunit 2